MANFFAMGGYAAFVWPAYAVSALVLGVAVVLTLRAHARARKLLRQLEEEVGETGEKET
jgi:heme exporter protein D